MTQQRLMTLHHWQRICVDWLVLKAVDCSPVHRLTLIDELRLPSTLTTASIGHLRSQTEGHQVLVIQTVSTASRRCIYLFKKCRFVGASYPAASAGGPDGVIPLHLEIVRRFESAPSF